MLKYLLIAVMLIGFTSAITPAKFECWMCHKILPSIASGDCESKCGELPSLSTSCSSICTTLAAHSDAQFPCALAGYCAWTRDQVKQMEKEFEGDLEPLVKLQKANKKATF
eukprot:TRINITY_DN3937_c0_g5_i1.p2 TRINITY_DN3937_c0_g5~~TRINITY_DN3937_c0_g5_i1.p2  ORF type:complete len:111 (+),score=0.12 TRINITY_DN3937_c0_g5_i1:72-404(+)